MERVSTSQQFVAAIIAFMKEKGVCRVSFDRSDYDENALTKNDMPWCILFDEFIDTVFVPSLAPDSILSNFSREEREWIARHPVCIGLSVTTEGGAIFYDFFDGTSNCIVNAENYAGEDFDSLFHDVYSALWDGGMSDDEADIYLMEKGFTYDIDPQVLDADCGVVAEAVAEEAGQSVTYCESIDLGDAFPTILEIAKDPSIENLSDPKATLSTLRFLAKNGRLFPKEMESASYEEFVNYFQDHRKDILLSIRLDIEMYYTDRTGKNLTQKA